MAEPIRSINSFDDSNYLEWLEQEKTVSPFRNQLLALSESEIDALVSKEINLENQVWQAQMKSDEAARAHNQPWANLDVDYWSKISFWTLEEAVAISLNKDPRKVKWGSLKPLTNVSDFAVEFEAKLMLVERAKEMGQLWAKTTPSTFLAWAERTRFEMPLELVETAKSLGIQVSDWKTHYDEQVKRADAARAEVKALTEKGLADSQENLAFLDRMRAGQKEIDRHKNDRMDLLNQQLGKALEKVKGLEAKQKPKADLTPDLNPRIRETLLKMIIGMAVDYYGYDPKQTKSPFPRELSDVLIGQGLQVSDDTIRKYLQEAAQLLPPPQTE